MWQFLMYYCQKVANFTVNSFLSILLSQLIIFRPSLNQCNKLKRLHKQFLKTSFTVMFGYYLENSWIQELTILQLEYVTSKQECA